MATQTPDSGPESVAAAGYQPRYIDIGINLADPVFRGKYRGKKCHTDDLSGVVSRAQDVGCQKLIITGSDLKSSRQALEIAQQYPGVVYTTAGIHPCSSAMFGSKSAGHDSDGHTMPCDPDPSQPVAEDEAPDAAKTADIMGKLAAMVSGARDAAAAAKAGALSPLVSLGELGLDYDRLHFCSRRLQLHSFAAQLDFVLGLPPGQQLPLFLHSRAAHADFVALLRDKFGPRLERLERGGVVHSFTGTAAEMRELMDMGLYIGTNGCSFKTADNCDVVREIRLDRLMLETDGPWCEIRPTHEGWKYLVADARREREAAAAAAVVSESGAADPAATDSPAPASASTSEAPSGASTPAQQQQQQNRPKKQKGQQQQKKKEEPEVPERFRSVKKEKWVEGAMVKGRNEPCSIERVARVVAGIKGVSVEEVCEASWRNTVRVFQLDGSADGS